MLLELNVDNIRCLMPALTAIRFEIGLKSFEILSSTFYKGQQDADLDVSGWLPGIYIAVV